MARASAQQIAAMDAAQAEAERLLEAAELRARAIEAGPQVLRTDLQEASLLAIRNARRQYELWTDTQEGGLRRWANDGRTQDGRPYTPQEWMDFGRELGEVLAQEAQLVLTHNLFTLYTPAGAVLAPVVNAFAGAGVKAEATARAAAEVVQEALAAVDPRRPWSTRTKLAVGAAAGTVVLGVVAYLASSVAQVGDLLKKEGGP
jgi:hypothetical protein